MRLEPEGNKICFVMQREPKIKAVKTSKKQLIALQEGVVKQE